ncbi:MAG TPA: long-chain fatty acid--CoA ligase [Candidatus Binatia bacterium]|nr:long-chain fatty acid--CoA ligase [Candidatus Binatia bacterium]
MSLEMELAAAIRAEADGGPRIDFAPWALRVFRHQYERNPAYRAFCDRRGVTPDGVAGWEDVPAVPTAAFRHVDLTCGPAQAVFVSSGTTAGADTRSRHLVPHLDLYRASAVTTFRRFVLPDDARLHALFLLPPPALRPESSLVRMCSWVGRDLSVGEEWMAGPLGLDVDALVTRLRTAEQSGQAVLLAGPTSGFAELFATGQTFRLGPGSRVMDTGGPKGMKRSLSRAGFLRACWNQLGIAGYFCVNEYGMSELCSQRYDSVLADRLHGRSLAPRRLLGPTWLRTRVLDPDTLQPMPVGRPGLLCHHDLANAGSVSVVLTEDIGRDLGDGAIELTGRVPGAMPRGCGLLLAEMATA